MSRWNKVVNGMVTERVNEYMDSPLEGTIAKVIEALKLEEQTYGVTHTNLRIDKVPEDYEEGYKFVLLGDRPATPEEIAAQAKEDAEAEEQRKKWDLQQLERLQAKYGQCKQDCAGGVEVAPGRIRTGKDI